MRRQLLAWLLALPVVAGCAPLRDTHERLHTTLWLQRSAEFELCATQAYRLALSSLDAAIEAASRDPGWTAAVEQSGDGEDKPPAIILDIDETVLNNGGFEARLVKERGPFRRDAWRAWVEGQSVHAIAVPGAVEFVKAAAGKSFRGKPVSVFYVSNRRVEEKDDTLRALAKIGLHAKAEQVLLKGANTPWGEEAYQGDDKAKRRKFVASGHRILLLLGDDLNDFVSGALQTGAAGGIKPTPEERSALAKKYEAYWGTRWIILPNPAYGSWQAAVVGSGEGLTDDDALRLKFGALRTFD